MSNMSDIIIALDMMRKIKVFSNARRSGSCRLCQFLKITEK